MESPSVETDDACATHALATTTRGLARGDYATTRAAAEGRWAEEESKDSELLQ